MKRKMIVAALLAVFLTGCADTMVYLPAEEGAELRGATVIHIPVKQEETAGETESQGTEAPAEPEGTEPVKEETTTLTKKTTTSTSKGTTNKETTSKGTITGSGSQKPAATQPPATKPNVTEPPATEPNVTEPPATEPPATQPPLYDISDYQMGDLEYAMLDQINAHRAEADLPELWLDSWLCAIASCRSYEISLVWSHTRPDGRGYPTVLEDYGYGAGAVTELLVYESGSGNGAAMADRWMASDSHRESLLGDCSTAGIGVYRANGFTYVTCLLIG